MGAKLRLQYDREADILHISLRAPYPEQETEEFADEVIARINSDTTELEGLEFLFFSTRLKGNYLFELPVEGSLRLTSQKEPEKLTDTELWQRVKGLEGQTVWTLARPSRNKIVEVTTQKVVFEGSRTSVPRTDICGAYEELWQEGTLWADKGSTAHGHKGDYYLWSVTPAILLSAVPDQVEPIREQGKAKPAIRLKSGLAAPQEKLGQK